MSNVNLANVLGDLKSREEVMEEIRANRDTFMMYLDLREDFREKYVEFCMGVRGAQMTYDPFFKYIFDAEVHPERLSKLLSQILGRKVKVKRTLPKEHRRISEKGSLLVIDVLVDLETGE